MGEDQLDDLQLDEPMGLGAQDVLGGHQTFARKMTLFSQIGFETVFLTKLRWSP